MSHATGVRRFTTAVDESPLSHLGRWRIHLAAGRLNHGTDTVEEVARRFGCTSEYAFGRAFSRHRRQPLGRYRRLTRAG